jgi:hypothetical protein
MNLDEHLSDHFAAEAFADLRELSRGGLRANFTRQPRVHAEAWIRIPRGGFHFYFSSIMPLALHITK